MQMSVSQTGTGTIQFFDTDFSQTAETPEPGSGLLVGAAVAMGFWFRRRESFRPAS
jgi:PEP-CTERM motif-containing protein